MLSVVDLAGLGLPFLRFAPKWLSDTGCPIVSSERPVLSEGEGAEQPGQQGQTDEQVDDGSGANLEFRRRGVLGCLRMVAASTWVWVLGENGPSGAGPTDAASHRGEAMSRGGSHVRAGRRA